MCVFFFSISACIRSDKYSFHLLSTSCFPQISTFCIPDHYCIVLFTIHCLLFYGILLPVYYEDCAVSVVVDLFAWLFSFLLLIQKPWCSSFYILLHLILHCILLLSLQLYFFLLVLLVSIPNKTSVILKFCSAFPILAIGASLHYFLYSFPVTLCYFI